MRPVWKLVAFSLLFVSFQNFPLKSSLGQELELLLADGSSSPGRVYHYRNRRSDVIASRDRNLADVLVPKIGSIERLPSGETILCSGLDRSLIRLTPSGEEIYLQGGYLARQVRVSESGVLHWSGLETPLDNNPLPDGFLYRQNARGESETFLTFSQGDVGRDWWGAFALHNDRILISTLNAPARIYDVTDPGNVLLICQVPTRVSSFRVLPDGSLWVANGEGKLLRFEDTAQTARFETILDSTTRFKDFVVLNSSSSGQRRSANP